MKAKYVQHKHAGVHHRLVLISAKITTGGLKVRWYHAQIPGEKVLISVVLSGETATLAYILPITCKGNKCKCNLLVVFKSNL